MEETRPARRSSGVYDGHFGASSPSLNSQAGLAEHAAPPALGSRFSEGEGIQRTTAAGVASGRSGQILNTVGEGDQQQTPAAAAQPTVPFYKKRKFIISQIIIIPLGIALLFILLFPVVTAIAQLVVKRSTLNVEVAAITAPQNGSFTLGLQGYVAHTGFIPAVIHFTEPIQVSWLEDDGTETALGEMNFEALSAKHKRATINQTTTFNIGDEDAFGRFAGHMITASSFTWRMRSNNLHVQAAKFPMSKGIKFDKELTLNGFDSFNGNVVLKDLQLPSDNRAGGIDFVAVTGLTNPSPFSLNLGTVVFALSYKSVFMGLGNGQNTIINPGENEITLRGYLEHHDSASDLAVVSELFTNYINGDNSPMLATGRSTLQDDGSVISWLSTGLQALQLDVPFKPLNGAINPIRTIDIGDFALQFFTKTPWSPSAESRTVQATMELPFGFNLNIGEIQNDFNISKDGNPVAGLSTPLGASKSNISVLGQTRTAGTIDISITDTNLNCPDPAHPAFSEFNANLTSLDLVEFQLVGHSRAVATMSIGQITLDPIKVNVTTNLKGLQGLNGFTTIESVDVEGGTKDGITLAIDVNIINPSNLKLALGDLSLQLFRDDALLGTALMPNLTLEMGNNSVKATSNFEANNSPQGLQTLYDFVGKKDVELSIAGYDESTDTASLLEAFKTLKIDVVLPSLKTNLLDTAALTVLPTTGRANNISHVTVSLDNPFSTALHITRIQSTVSSLGIPLGTINTDTDFTSQPKSKTTSPQLDLDMNFDPVALFTITRALAVEAGLDVAPLDGIVDLGGYQYSKTTGPAPSKHRRDNLYTGFELPKFVQTAFKKLQSDVQLTTDVTLGDYQTKLEYTQSNVPTGTDDSLDFILPILAQPIVQKIVTASILGIDTVLITDPKQESFGTKLKGSISNAGPFDAKIAFGSGLSISWAGKPIGTIKMDAIQVVGDVGGDIDVESLFEVTDVEHLTEFTKVLLTDESFEWEISGENVTVSALGISVDGVSLTTKKVTLKGFNGLKGGVRIKSFDLPSNDPAGGIHLTLEATTANPSQVGIQLSHLGFETFAGGMMIAPVQTKAGITLSPGSTSAMSLVGRLIPQDSSAGLAAVSDVFNNFIHGKDSDVVVHGASAGPADVTWLNEGIKSLQIATVLPNQGTLNIIKSINLNELQLLFTENTAYDPSTSSKSTDAAFTLPFRFPIDISALEQTINIAYEGQSFAQLAIPKGPSNTDVQDRIIHLTFDDVPFAVFSDGHGTFDKFVAATTIGKVTTMGLSGSANADAKTAVGLISLSDIAFSVDSSIDGLQGLNTRRVTVSNLDVNHGYSDYLLIKVDSAIFNPSNLTIGTGDVSFSLSYLGQTIGSADIGNMIVTPGNGSYPTDVHFAPQGGASQAAGRALLENFLQGIDVDTTIFGNTGSTPIDSLKDALSQILLTPVTIPALHETLIKSASLTFPIDIVKTGIAQTSFTLANPFTASINLLRVGATASYHNLTLGVIDDVDASANPIHADGHGSVTSPRLPMKYNLDPVTIIKFLSIAAQTNGVDLGPLVDMFKLVLANPEYHPPVTTTVDTQAPTCVSGHQFDVGSAILKALENLKVDLAVDTSVKLDDFATDLSFAQHSIPAITDKTALYLIGAVAAPVAQSLVDGSSLEFTEANITSISDDGFDLSLRGSLTNVGPLDALITFTEPVTVTWQDQDIATIALPPVCAAANIGVPNYETNARLTITDLSKFTSFATFLLHNPSFDWTISTPKLRLTALGTIFDNVSLTKKVTFKAFNNLPGVTISNFQLPSDDPEGGIHIETDALIPSEAQLGIDMGTVSFQAYFEGARVGPLSGDHLFLAANSQTATHLSGRIIPQSGSDLDTIGVLFSRFLAGENQTLTTKGDSVQPDGSSQPVTWLSDAFKTLSLEVILPGREFDVIQSIELADLAVTMQEQSQAFAPPTTSKSTLATYKNPFGFSLQVFEAAQNIILGSGGVDIAELDIPSSPADGEVSTGNVVDLHISWEDLPLRALNPTAFAGMFAAVTNQGDIELTLKGTANVSAHTTIGDVPISGIPFDVSSELKGINAFGHTATSSNISVTGSGGAGGKEYIVSPLTINLQNPSNVSLFTVDIALPVIYKGVTIGRAAISPFNLLPGANVVPTEFHYQPENANDTVAQGFLTTFLTTGETLPLLIHGDTASTPFPSLSCALSLLQLGTALTGLNQPNFITHITVTITLESLVTNLVSVDFDLHNPLDASLTLSFVQNDAGVNGEIYAHFDQSFSSFTVPPGQTVNSGIFGNVLLTQGALASLDIIPLGYLDTFTAVTAIVGDNGYQIPWLQLQQTGVPTTYELALGLAGMAAKAKAISASLESSSAELSSISSTAAESSSEVTTTVSAEGGASSSASEIAESSSEFTSATPPTPSAAEGSQEPTVEATHVTAEVLKTSAAPEASPEAKKAQTSALLTSEAASELATTATEIESPTSSGSLGR